MGVSLHPKDAVSGGVFEEGIYRFTKTHFESWDYDGKAARSAVGMMTDLVYVETGRVEPRKFWSVGGADQWSVSSDGQEITTLGTARGIRENSNFMQLTSSLLDAGYPDDKLNTYRVADIYDGMLAYLISKKAPGREGMEPQAPRLNPNTGQPYPQRDPEVVVVAEIKEYPWDVSDELKAGVADGQTAAVPQGPSARPQAARAPRGAAAQANRPPAAPAAPPATPAQVTVPVAASSNGASDGSREALELVFESVDAVGGPGNWVERQAITTLAFQRYQGRPEQPKVMATIVKADTFARWQAEGLVVVDGTRFTTMVEAIPA